VHPNLLIFILFAISLNFPNLIKIGFSGAPFGFLFCSLLVFPYLVNVIIGKIKIEIQLLAFLLLFLVTFIWSIYSINLNVNEYIIRFFQVFAAFVVYTYSKKNFFINISNLKILKILLICQTPSFAFGIFEVINIFLDLEIISSGLLMIRSITASGREDVTLLNTIVLHFLEHSMSSFYFISFLIIIPLLLSSKNWRQEIKSDYMLLATISLFFIIALFHRSTSFILILTISLFLITIYSRRFLLLMAFLPLVIVIIISAPQLLIKISMILNGNLITSDMFRATTIFSSFTTFYDTFLFGSGSGTFSNTYYPSLINFVEYLNLDYELESLILSNNYVESYKYGNRPPLNSAYSVLISEYGILFIIFIILFHKGCFKLKKIYDVYEVIIILCLFLSYPIAYPYLWLVLGLIHMRRSIDLNLKMEKRNDIGS